MDGFPLCSNYHCQLNLNFLFLLPSLTLEPECSPSGDRGRVGQEWQPHIEVKPVYALGGLRPR